MTFCVQKEIYDRIKFLKNLSVGSLIIGLVFMVVAMATANIVCLSIFLAAILGRYVFWQMSRVFRMTDWSEESVWLSGAGDEFLASLKKYYLSFSSTGLFPQRP